MADITNAGYLLKNQNEYFEQERDLYLSIDPEWSLDPSTPDGLKLASDAEIFANLDETLQAAYNSKDPRKARGVDLDAICEISGVRRDKGSPSQVNLELGGVPGTVILAGRKVASTVDDTQWIITNPSVIQPSGTVTVGALCSVNGPTPAAANTLTKIATTVGGWQTVTNPTVAVMGTGVQSDASLRAERNITISKPSSNMVISILGALGSVKEATRFKVYENEESTVDSDGLPGNSIAVLVHGGSDDDVARAIYDNRGPGTKQHQLGTPVAVTVQSERFPQQSKIIKFGRPSIVNINIVVNIKDDGSLPVGVESMVKTAIIEYVGGTLIDSSVGFNPLGFNIAEDVPEARLRTPVNQVIGQYGNSYVTSMTVNGSSVVPIDIFELSNFDESLITVTTS